MSYVDPNSGAAPQPGAWAGAQAMPKGFAPTTAIETEEQEEPKLTEYAVEVPKGTHVGAALEEGVSAEKIEEELQEREAAAAEAQAQVEGSEENSEEEDEGYDPGKDNIDDVLAYVEANPDQREAVLAAEKDGKNRSTLVSQLED